jgi:hypothetical protein
MHFAEHVFLVFTCYNLQAGPPRTLGARGWGELPTNKILPYIPTPRSKFCLLAPAKLFTLQGISNGVTMGVPMGADIWGRPLAWLVPSPGEIRSPRQISE